MAQLNDDEMKLVSALSEAINDFVEEELPDLPSGVVKMQLVAQIFGATGIHDRALPPSIEKKMYAAWDELYEHMMWGWHNDES